jgi:hypothetical protein
MHALFPIVGMAANVSPAEQQISRATGQLAWEYWFYSIVI